MTQRNAEDPVETTCGKASSFGWLRRPELDTATGYAWERPDGTLYLSQCRDLWLYGHKQ